MELPEIERVEPPQARQNHSICSERDLRTLFGRARWCLVARMLRAQVFEQKFGSSITSVLEKSQKPDEKPMSFGEYLENKKNIFEVDEKGLVYLQQALSLGTLRSRRAQNSRTSMRIRDALRTLGSGAAAGDAESDPFFFPLASLGRMHCRRCWPGRRSRTRTS